MKNNLCLSVSNTVDEVPSWEHVLVVMDANARTGEREDESNPMGVMGAHRRDRRNGNGRRLVEFAASGRFSILPRSSLRLNA